MYRALREFAYSVDGINTRIAEKGSLVEPNPEAIEGLQAEGYIGKRVLIVSEKSLGDSAENKSLDAPAENKSASQLIPEDWRNLDWHDLRALANRLSGGPTRTKDDAIEAIEFELEVRAEAEENS